MDTQAIQIMTYVLIGGTALFFLVRYLGSKPKQCEVCGMDTKDLYNDASGKLVRLCRTHLIERWKSDVLSSSHKMVVIEPDVEDQNHAMGYLYGSVEQLGEWQYGKEAQRKMSDYLLSIDGKKCEECNMTATTAFIKKGDYSIPLMEKITATPTYLCTPCVVKKVGPILFASQHIFYEGVYAPTNEDGVYHSQEY